MFDRTPLGPGHSNNILISQTTMRENKVDKYENIVKFVSLSFLFINIVFALKIAHAIINV